MNDEEHNTHNEKVKVAVASINTLIMLNKNCTTSNIQFSLPFMVGSSAMNRGALVIRCKV